MNKEKQLEFLATQLFEEGNLELIAIAFDENYVAHDGDKSYQGHKFIRQSINKLRLAIPDIKIHKIEFLSQTDDTITWQRTFIGTHKVNMQGIPASMKKVKWNDLVVTRFEGERIMEDWLVSTLAFQLMIKQYNKKQEKHS